LNAVAVCYEMLIDFVPNQAFSTRVFSTQNLFKATKGLSYVYRSAKFFNFFARLFILFYFRSKKFRWSV